MLLLLCVCVQVTASARAATQAQHAAFLLVRVCVCLSCLLCLVVLLFLSFWFVVRCVVCGVMLLCSPIDQQRPFFTATLVNVSIGVLVVSLPFINFTCVALDAVDVDVDVHRVFSPYVLLCLQTTTAVRSSTRSEVWPSLRFTRVIVRTACLCCCSVVFVFVLCLLCLGSICVRAG